MPLSVRLAALAVQVRARCPLVPEVAILLGTGLGGVASRIETVMRIPYADLDGMPRSTAESQAGELLLGRLAGRSVVAFSGCLHCYEGHSPAEVVVPVRLARTLGASVLVMGSAAGGLDPRYGVGDVCVIEDHLNLMGMNPLVGPNDETVGPRWPDMGEPYDRRLLALAHDVALGQAQRLHQAVYAGVLGPSGETRAEYRMLRTLGADVVGMSTVPESIAAVHCGLRTLAFAIVTGRCLPEVPERADISATISVAHSAEPRLAALIAGVIARI